MEIRCNKSTMQEEINNLLKIRWWGNNTTRTLIDAWLENFENSDKEIGEFILCNMIYYTSDQIESYVLQLILKMQACFYRDICMGTIGQINEDMLNKKWRESMLRTRIIPLEKRVDAGSGANVIIRKIRELLNFYLSEEGIVSKLDMLGDYLKGEVDSIIFVDDFSGTGCQLNDFLNESIEIDGDTIKIKDLPAKFPRVSFQIYFLVIHRASIERNHDDLKGFITEYVEVIGSELDLRNYDCEMYVGISDKTKERIIGCIGSMSKRIQDEDEKYRKMDKYQLGLPIVFEHGCPNNSCVLLYAKTKSWNNLYIK